MYKNIFISLLILFTLGSCSQFFTEEKPEPKPVKWESLFNGDNFWGWTYSGEGKWWVEDSMITGYGKSGEKGGIMTEKNFEDFSLRFEFLLGKGQALVFLAADEKDSGLILELNEENGLKFIAGLKKDHSPVDIKANDWNDLLITSRNDSLKIAINGGEILSIGDQKLQKGHLSLQLQGDLESEVKFKNIEIKDF